MNAKERKAENDREDARDCMNSKKWPRKRPIRVACRLEGDVTSIGTGAGARSHEESSERLESTGQGGDSKATTEQRSIGEK